MVIVLAATVVLFMGWRLLWFLTDDAFIAFRYVSNSVLGHGYVWNAEPFRAVEGYTSFLWVALLDVVWRLFDVEPPAVANNISLLLGAGALMLGARMVWRLDWSEALRPTRAAWLGLVLLAVTTNRTFLTWASSGFETALFNVLFLLWMYVCLYARAWRLRDVFTLTLAAALSALTRPDGLVYVGASIGIVLVVAGTQAARVRASYAVASLPLLLVPAHLVWRYQTYGFWLPNTYYAKVVAPWPEAGIRFLLSYVVEYALWFVPVVALVAGVRGAWQRAMPDDPAPRLFGVRRAALVRTICLSAVATHVFYYALIVGGDHFEYRILSHLVVPSVVLLAWLVNRTCVTRRAAALVLGLYVLLALPVPWTHWAVTRHLESRQETRRMRVAIAPHWPVFVRGYAVVFDRLQSWLIGHWIAVRHQEHKVNQAYLASLYPTREEGARIGTEGLPVHAFQAVGVAAWTLPHVAIIDLLGLNDLVVARTPVDLTRPRGMAHERRAPEGYADCFRPNVFLRPGLGLRVVERETPLTEEDVRACEAEWARRVRKLASVP